MNVGEEKRNEIQIRIVFTIHLYKWQLHVVYTHKKLAICVNTSTIVQYTEILTKLGNWNNYYKVVSKYIKHSVPFPHYVWFVIYFHAGENKNETDSPDTLILKYMNSTTFFKNLLDTYIMSLSLERIWTYIYSSQH
jgi:hypothetical protein